MFEPIIPAKPTLYAGVQFRSRLEATWACFFDHLEWKWEYEPSVYDGPGWLPDFLLRAPEWSFLCEAKPVRTMDGWIGHECHAKIQKRTSEPVFLLGVDPSVVSFANRRVWTSPLPDNWREAWAKAKNLVQWNPPVKPAKPTVKVYLAGKVEKHGWREALGDFQEWSFSIGSKSAHELDSAILFNGWTCVGPFVFDCDHGTFHGDGLHGQACADDRPHIQFMERQDIFSRSMDQIEQAEAVFAYIDSAECFGTLFELGAAYKLGKPYGIGFAPGINRDDFWFICEEAFMVAEDELPDDAFRQFAERWDLWFR